MSDVGAGAYAVAFAAGAASFLAPCVVPLMPAYIAAIAPEAVQGSVIDTKVVQSRILSGALLYILGFSLVFVPLGLGASVLGGVFKDHQDAITRVGGVLIILFGLRELGVLKRLLPQRATAKLPRPKTLPGRGGRFRPVLLGLVLGCAWTPCVGPVLGTVLVLAARSSSAVTGGGLLFVYALGVGVPFLTVAFVVSSVPSAMRFLTRRAHLISRIAGIAMLVLGVLLVSGVYKVLAGFLARFAVNV